MKEPRVISLLAVGLSIIVLAANADGQTASARLRVDQGHPWRPPFGLARVGHPPTAQVEISTSSETAKEYTLAVYRNGQETSRELLRLTGRPPYTNRVELKSWPTELALFAKGASAESVELARQTIQAPAFEAEAVAQPDRVINPVDLGTIFAPHDWLLLADGQRAEVSVAALARDQSRSGAQVMAWFESAPEARVNAPMPLAKDQRAQVSLELSAQSVTREQDVLRIAIIGSEKQELWTKKIRTMLVHQAPRWPAFGATETKLRYDAPISMLDRITGVLSSIPYADGWAPQLQDVVVSFPNGARFVFWRGSSYVPFWAGAHNTALCYEWAETSPPPDGFVDCVEPLMDKELRYGRVEIIESTSARVHVRWTYQSCDFAYKVWGDAVAEDFYFYPDGFGTRVLNLAVATQADYELSEFIILSPAAAFPFEILPTNIVDVLFLDGLKRPVAAPFAVEGQKAPGQWPEEMIRKVKQIPAVFRVRLHRDEAPTAVYFNPLDANLPPALFGAFSDRGQMVTPVYWGSHWPLGRGKTTGWTIDDRIYVSPAHNSVMSWARSRPKPVSVTTQQGLDTLGRSKSLTTYKWVWLIGMSDASDERLLQRARSFSQPPALQLKGARLDFDAYVPERRAVGLVVEADVVTITIKPTGEWVNPVFEFLRTPRTLKRLTLAGRPLEGREFAWDGRTLWLDTCLADSTDLQIEFGP